MNRTLWTCLLGAAVALAVAGLAYSGETRPSPSPPERADERAAETRPQQIAEQSSSAAEGTAGGPAEPVENGGINPFRREGGFLREDALPGVIEQSDGTLRAGGLYTTRQQPWIVYVAKEKRWRRIPFVAVLGIEAVVIEEKMELRWRWKAMGEPERVYTGEKYPTRRFLWRFHLIDDSYITGTVKGQPLWVERNGQRSKPMVLHERSRGKAGESLEDLVYVKRVIVSRRLMEQVTSQGDRTKAKPSTRPRPPADPQTKPAARGDGEGPFSHFSLKHR
jgi:hypothetical protein